MHVYPGRRLRIQVQVRVIEHAGERIIGEVNGL